MRELITIQAGQAGNTNSNIAVIYRAGRVRNIPADINIFLVW
jgi:uncharacterized protein (UPF0333 family)